MALATITNLEAALGRSLSAEETTRGEYLLRSAEAAILAETRWRFEGEHTIARRPHQGRITIPALAPTVSEVREVDETDGTATVLTDWTLRGRTIYGLTGSCLVEVDFAVADGTVPQEITDLTAGIAAASLPTTAGVSQASAGSFQVSYVDATGRVYFSKSDKLILAKYRTPRRAIQL